MSAPTDRIEVRLYDGGSISVALSSQDTAEEGAELLAQDVKEAYLTGFKERIRSKVVELGGRSGLNPRLESHLNWYQDIKEREGVDSQAALVARRLEQKRLEEALARLKPFFDGGAS